ncbi:hypothetical protein P170DRAFT_360554 [Aspergillus steynii IBT 23096]|uniref:Sequence orphan n=1 Tax=Aspergillus steynii IBT 23096 TaxID=1392250 RepID=A0A2I2G6G4_9EURO|nr:uncharacterized protein P170DRAFT_360554 [Aspergillus steynii IBT 23096]PLB48462.1 hypothetical protein P170DRAFT_360554 [Aspergillus steynii IBT 23096]
MPSEPKNEATRQIRRLVIDATSAAIAAGLVTPAVSIMDRHRRIVVENSCAPVALKTGLRKHFISAIRSPRRFATSRPCLLVFALYMGTFGVANASQTLLEARSPDVDPAIAQGTTVLSTLSVNVPLGIYKDTVFSKLFGCAVVARGGSSVLSAIPRTPWLTYASFLLRDGVTIYTSFSLPHTVAAAMPDVPASYQHAASIASQMVVPAIGQILNTPIHLIGLEIYNRQGNTSPASTLALLRRDLASATITRMCRIIPAFGLGILTNNEMRSWLNKPVAAT